MERVGTTNFRTPQENKAVGVPYCLVPGSVSTYPANPMWYSVLCTQTSHISL